MQGAEGVEELFSIIKKIILRVFRLENRPLLCGTGAALFSNFSACRRGSKRQYSLEAVRSSTAGWVCAVPAALAPTFASSCSRYSTSLSLSSLSCPFSSCSSSSMARLATPSVDCGAPSAPGCVFRSKRSSLLCSLVFSCALSHAVDSHSVFLRNKCKCH